MIPADVLSKYGPDALSGIILMATAPHIKAYPDIADPDAFQATMGLTSDDAAVVANAVPQFVLSCIAPGSKMPYDVQAKWMGGAASKVRTLTSLAVCSSS